MNKEEAMQHGLGYAAGREDGTRTPTVPPAGVLTADCSPYIEFAKAYALAWDEYNRGKRWSMTNCRDAYDRWQSSGGVSIFGEDDTTEAQQARLAERMSKS